MAYFGNRIVVLIDMDCFFCQVETKLNPDYEGKPMAVVQYNQWKLGGIIAVNYEARDFGVTRHMRGEEAKEKCPELLIASVPCLRGKSDTSRYRSAGRSVIEALKNKCDIIERASIDEAYLDITQLVNDQMSANTITREDYISQLKNTFVVGYSESGINDEDKRREGLENWLTASFDELEDLQSQRLAIAGLIVEELRNEVLDKTGYKCSAGISYNKILAKLACGLHKPNKQTILPAAAVPDLFSTLPVKKVRNLGGKFGDVVVDSLKCNVMADLLRFPLQYLQKRFDEKTGLWLYNISRGIDHEPVTTRFVSKSIGACKKFPGKQAITTLDMLKHWLGELTSEVCDRLEQDFEENERRATLLTVSFHFYQDRSLVSQSKSCAMSSYKPEKLLQQSVNIVSKFLHHPIAFLGLSAGKFVTRAKSSKNFMNFFKVDSKNSEAAVKSEEEMDQTCKTDFENTSEGFDEENVEQIQPNSPTEKVSSFFTTNTKEQTKSSPCTEVKNSLKVDCFKKSFFMNMLKDNRKKSLPLQRLYPETTDSQDEVDIKPLEYKREESTSEKNETTENIEEITENELEAVEGGSKSPTVVEPSIVTLKEIFPNPNDIDVGIIPFLPLHLQKEANEILKRNRESKEKPAENKQSKTKTLKGKSNQKNINAFLIKTDSTENINQNLKKCPLCDQLIPAAKFNEHKDYHIAQRIQQEMNESPPQSTSKRKYEETPRNSPRKRLSDENVNNVKSKLTIASFFQ